MLCKKQGLNSHRETYFATFFFFFNYKFGENPTHLAFVQSDEPWVPVCMGVVWVPLVSPFNMLHFATDLTTPCCVSVNVIFFSPR